MKRFVSIGECMIEMSGGMDGQYRLGFAGDTLNTAWYARALLGADWAVDYVTALGDDLYSRQMRAFFTAHKIGTAHIQEIPGKRAGLYMIHQAEGDRQFTYWRGQSAAKAMADDVAVITKALEGADLIYFSGVSLAILAPHPRGRLLKAIVTARDQGARVVFDPNARPALWTSQAIMGSAITAAASVADIVLPTFSDEVPVFGDKTPEATAARYQGLSVDEVVVKNGAEAALVATQNERHSVVAAKGAKLIDATGAGDAFNGAYLAARLKGADPQTAAKEGHRLAAIVIGHKGALIDPGLLD